MAEIKDLTTEEYWADWQPSNCLVTESEIEAAVARLDARESKESNDD